MTPLDYALRYASFGWPVLPVKRDKKPLGGNGFDHATTDDATIRDWFTRWPDANIGIALSPAGLAAIDIDPRNGGSLEAVKLSVEETLSAQTGGGGWHLLMRIRPGARVPDNLGPGVDVKCRGYIVAEPSVHESGRLYGWLDWDVFAEPVPKIIDAPEWAYSAPKKPSEQAAGAFDVREAVRRILTAAQYHENMIRLAAHYAALGMRAADIAEVIRGLFEAITERDDRWQARYSEINAAVESAMSKFEPKRDTKPEAIELVRADQVPVEPIRWLWGGYLARGKLHIIAGAPGVAKTTIALALAATLTTGERWPDGTRATLGNVLIWSGEDDPADTLIPRLRAMDADVSRIAFVASASEIVNGEECRIAFDPAKHLAALMVRIASDPPALLIIDPIRVGSLRRQPQERRNAQGAATAG